MCLCRGGAESLSWLITSIQKGLLLSVHEAMTDDGEPAGGNQLATVVLRQGDDWREGNGHDAPMTWRDRCPWGHWEVSAHEKTRRPKPTGGAPDVSM